MKWAYAFWGTFIFIAALLFFALAIWETPWIVISAWAALWAVCGLSFGAFAVAITDWNQWRKHAEEFAPESDKEIVWMIVTGLAGATIMGPMTWILFFWSLAFK